eukprot:5553386-Pleurochrysis_carterae.AAC.4
MTNKARAASCMQFTQIRGVRVREGLTCPRTPIGTAMWPSGLTAKRRTGAQPRSAIAGACIA